MDQMNMNDVSDPEAYFDDVYPTDVRPDILTVALTGTPGTGKTTVSRILERRGFHVLFLTEFVRENNIPSDRDEERDCLVVDMDALEKAVAAHISKMPVPTDGKSSVLVIESHMAHYLSGTAIVFRTHPDILKSRLEVRGYSDEKIHENVMSEALDVILCESYDWCGTVLEIDNSNKDPEDSADAVEEIIGALLRIGECGGSDIIDDDTDEPDDGGVEIFMGDDDLSGAETVLEKDDVLRKYVPGSIDWSHLAD